ncbi:acyl-CoA hydrolase [Helicobacter cetorum MIT 00-7128]|uniref:Acyl-CoA hydrolase n=1 Tax=Helicobacter cetorum (strain ATCC BAA-429 / MIT 00-7128) TaxID=182217 RepID=I0EMA7_HELC0|nr:acyl-CoA hydrolase [Helicobacter cetorum MIT 00-7128]
MPHSLETNQATQDNHFQCLIDTADPTKLMMSYLVVPTMANFSNVMHGGELLNLLDKVAYVCSTRYCGKGTVTLSVDGVTFKHPIPVGNLLTFLASINYVGNTSCEVGIKVLSEDFKTHVVTHTNSCYFTMVAVENGKPSAMPKYEPKTDREKRRYEGALKRKEMRMEGYLTSGKIHPIKKDHKMETSTKNSHKEIEIEKNTKGEVGFLKDGKIQIETN